VIDLPDTVPLPDDLKLLLAHELFHDWLGSSLVDPGSLVWFSEGFTDYFAIWHATAAGMLPPARFAERILGVEREARSGSPLGRIAFAQPGVDWRDDGPNETMAYRGGALLAFIVDAELRRRSGRTVPAVVRGLLESAPRTYQLSHIRDVMTKLGLADVYHRSIAGTQLPDAFPLLRALGFDETVEQAGLTYLGIEARFDGPPDATDVVPAVVTAIDSVRPQRHPVGCDVGHAGSGAGRPVHAGRDRPRGGARRPPRRAAVESRSPDGVFRSPVTVMRRRLTGTGLRAEPRHPGGDTVNTTFGGCSAPPSDLSVPAEPSVPCRVSATLTRVRRCR
jgi:hypothetical protein